MFCFLSLAKKWPSLMATWTNIEKKLPSYNCLIAQGKCAHKIKMVTFVILFLSLGELNYNKIYAYKMIIFVLFSAEHLLNAISIIHFTLMCNPTNHPVRDFLIATSSQFFFITEYAAWKGILAKLFNLIATFLWTYMDVFVILISIGLSTRFKQINDSLNKHKGLVRF